VPLVIVLEMRLEFVIGFAEGFSYGQIIRSQAREKADFSARPRLPFRRPSRLEKIDIHQVHPVNFGFLDQYVLWSEMVMTESGCIQPGQLSNARQDRRCFAIIGYRCIFQEFRHWPRIAFPQSHDPDRIALSIMYECDGHFDQCGLAADH